MYTSDTAVSDNDSSLYINQQQQQQYTDIQRYYSDGGEIGKIFNTYGCCTAAAVKKTQLTYYTINTK